MTKNNVANNSSADPNGIALSVMPAPTQQDPNPSFGAPVRIPIEPDSGGVSNTHDHFIPGIGADPNTSGSSAHLGLFYYTYPIATCQAFNADNLCSLRVGYASSASGGATGTVPTELARMTIAGIARSSQGPMVGDYSTADVMPAGSCAGRAIATFSVGPEPQDNALAEAMYAPRCGLPIGLTILGNPVTRPPSGRAPVTPPQIHAFRTAH